MVEFTPISDRLMIPHTAFATAVASVRQRLEFAGTKTEADGLAIIGPSGAGKSSAMHVVMEEHEPKRGPKGMEIPILYVIVPSAPTVKSLAGAILEALHAPDPHRGTADQMTHRIRVLMRETGVLMLMIDEFQHFFDRGKQKIMYTVADWLKILIDKTRVTVVVAGLPNCLGVIDANEQLARRFASPVHLSRFHWEVAAERKQFIRVLATVQQEFMKRYQVPVLESEDMALRFWIASGGLMGYLTNILRQAERNALVRDTRTITLEDLHIAHMEAVWASLRIPDLPQPFLNRDPLAPTVDFLQQGLRVGKAIQLPQVAPHTKTRKSHESLNSLLSK